MAGQRLDKRFQDFLQGALEDIRWDVEQCLKQELDGSLGTFECKTSGFDPYAVLGLEKNCSDNEIKRRYLELIKLLHPDVTGGKTTFLATLVNLAYQTLCRERNLS